MTPAPTTALVLSGGGARGAYEAGVVAGLIDVLGTVRFDLLAGTSVGAINAAYLASCAERPDLGIEQLVALWEGLSLRRHLRLEPHPARSRALLDVRPFEAIVRREVDWAGLARSIDGGALKGLFVAALEVASGRTAMFADLSPDTHWHPSRDPQRFPVRERITSEHVLASAAIPAVFPPRRVGGGVFYDGSLRFNTPIAPVLRAGADRLVVVSPLFHGHRLAPAVPPDELDVLFLAGKMLHAVLLDPFDYDLAVLERFNELIATLDLSLSPEERARFDARVAALRGVPYRTVGSLVLSPSRDLGAMALDYVSHRRRKFLRQGLGGWLVGASGRRLAASGTDLVSYLLFDGGFTRQLIALGRADVAARADEVRAFFR
jgi:NTE family protein